MSRRIYSHRATNMAESRRWDRIEYLARYSRLTASGKSLKVLATAPMQLGNRDLFRILCE